MPSATRYYKVHMVHSMSPTLPSTVMVTILNIIGLQCALKELQK